MPKSAKDKRALAKKKAKEGTQEAETQNGEATEQPKQQTGKAVEKPKAESKTESKKPVEKKDDAVSLKEKGNSFFEKQDYPRALELYTKAIEADAKNHSLYSNRSATFAAMRNFTKALDDADKCVELKAQWPKGHYRRGFALEGLLRYPEAYQAYQTGLALDANDANLKKASAELKVLLDELKITEKELADKKTGDNPDNDKFETMVKWLRDGGAKFPKLYLQYYSEDYRGVHCLTKIPNDDVVLYVPLQLIMTSEVAKASEICKKIIQGGVDLRSTHSYLAACLLQEKAKGPKSYWYPYINILPEKYANMPIFFDEEQLAWIQNSFTLQKIADRIDSLRREYEAIRRVVPEFSKFSLNEFIWGRLAVITRIFGLVVDGNKTDGLVPYADMLNHKRPNEPGGGKDQCDTKWTYDDGRKGFIITMVRTIQRGDQIYDSYGRKCNSRFFVNYGFTLEDNEDNEVVIRLQMPSNDPHFMMKLRFLGGKAENAKREFQVPGFYKEKKCHELFSFLRFINAQDAEILPFSTSEAKLEDVEPISIKNEIKCLEQLHKAAKEVYDKFKETLEDDTKLLASGKLEMYSNNRNCVVMRHGEKVVLRQLMSLAEEGIPLLKSNYATVKKLAGKAQAGATTLDQYITQVIVPLVKKGA